MTIKQYYVHHSKSIAWPHHSSGSRYTLTGRNSRGEPLLLNKSTDMFQPVIPIMHMNADNCHHKILPVSIRHIYKTVGV